MSYRDALKRAFEDWFFLTFGFLFVLVGFLGVRDEDMDDENETN